jgi:hypothetical protein
MRHQDYERKTTLLHETESGLIPQGEVDRRCFRYIPFRVEFREEAFICAGVLSDGRSSSPDGDSGGIQRSL